MILAIETSCDDTCAAVVTRAGEIRSNVISSQGIHDRFGGVVPEIASRHHLERIDDVVADALRIAGAQLSDLDLVAVTRGPGLVSALLVGMASAKATAAALSLPLAPVDHLHGHVAAGFLDGSSLEPPFLTLIAPAALDPERLAETLRDDAGGWLAVGDGAVRFRPVLEAAGVAVAPEGGRPHRVSALEHCRLAAGMKPQNPELVVPEYLRIPDAELALRAREAAVTT